MSGTAPAPLTPPTAAIAIGTWIQAKRLQLGWSQLELARRLGINVTTVSRWERDARVPQLDQFCSLCLEFGASADEALRLPSSGKRRPRPSAPAPA